MSEAEEAAPRDALHERLRAIIGDESTADDSDGVDSEASSATYPELSLSSDAVFVLDGEQVTGEQIRRRMMRGSEYAKNAERLAAQRHELSTEREGYAKSLAFFEQENRSVLQHYSQIDWQRMMADRPAEYQQRRQELQQLMQRQQQIDAHKSQFIAKLQQQRDARRRQDAEAAVETLRGIYPEWNDEMYAGLGAIAETYGFSRSEFNDYTDPRIMQLLHDAGRYRKADAEAKQAIRRQPQPQTSGGSRDRSLSTEQARRMTLHKKALAGDSSANSALLRDRLVKRFGRT